MKKNEKMFRQGDVLIVKVADKLPKAKLKPVKADAGRTILAYGEVTGHAHALSSRSTQLLEKEGEEKAFPLLEVKEKSDLRHEEHSTITFDEGVYEIRRQREYTPAEIVQVRD